MSGGSVKMQVDGNGGIGIGLNGATPSSILDVSGGSLTIRGAGAGIKLHGLISGTSAQFSGTVTSTSGFIAGGSTVTTITWGDGTISTSASVGGGSGGGGGGLTPGTTRSFMVRAGGEVVVSSTVYPFYDDDLFVFTDTCTIYQYMFELDIQSNASATFAGFAVGQSSNAFSVYTGPAITSGATSSVWIGPVAVVVPSSSSFSVLVASTSVSQPPVGIRMRGKYFCRGS